MKLPRFVRFFLKHNICHDILLIDFSWIIIFILPIFVENRLQCVKFSDNISASMVFFFTLCPCRGLWLARFTRSDDLPQTPGREPRFNHPFKKLPCLRFP